MSKPLLTLTVIARNEEATLERCLASCRPLVDDIVVVDTGSADATPTIARRLGARVFTRLWDDDFSAARNFAIEQVRTPWILTVDADEELKSADIPALRSLLADTVDTGGPDGFAVRVDNKIDGGSVAPFHLVRVFRNRPEIRYSGRIHEEVTTSLARLHGGPVAPPILPLVLLHDGYLREVRTGHDKRERNLRLLQRALKNDSRQALLQFALARELLLTSGERIFPGEGFAEAVTALTRAHAAAQSEDAPEHLALFILTTLAGALTADARPTEALEILAGVARQKHRSGNGPSRHIPASRALVEFTYGRALLAAAGEDKVGLENAAARFASLAGKEIDAGFIDVDTRVCDVFAMERQAEALGRIGMRAEAHSLLEGAASAAPGYAGPRVRRAELYLRHGETRRGFESYREALEADCYDPEAWLGVARLLRLLGEREQALDSVDNALGLVPLWDQAILEKATIRFLQDAPGEVMTEWSVYRDMSAVADVACLMAEGLAGQPLTGLGDWPAEIVQRSMLSITMGLRAGKRSDLLDRVKTCAGPAPSQRAG